MSSQVPRGVLSSPSVPVSSCLCSRRALCPSCFPSSSLVCRRGLLLANSLTTSSVYGSPNIDLGAKGVIAFKRCFSLLLQQVEKIQRQVGARKKTLWPLPGGCTAFAGRLVAESRLQFWAVYAAGPPPWACRELAGLWDAGYLGAGEPWASLWGSPTMVSCGKWTAHRSARPVSGRAPGAKAAAGDGNDSTVTTCGGHERHGPIPISQTGK